MRSSGFGVTLFHQAPGRGSVIVPERRAEDNLRPTGPIKAPSIAADPSTMAEGPPVSYTPPLLDEMGRSRSWVSFAAWSSLSAAERLSGSAERDEPEHPDSVRTQSGGSKSPSPTPLSAESHGILPKPPPMPSELDVDWNSRKLGRYHAELYRQRSRASSTETGGVSVATGDSGMF